MRRYESDEEAENLYSGVRTQAVRQQRPRGAVLGFGEQVCCASRHSQAMKVWRFVVGARVAEYNSQGLWNGSVALVPSHLHKTVVLSAETQFAVKMLVIDKRSTESQQKVAKRENLLARSNGIDKFHVMKKPESYTSLKFTEEGLDTIR